MSEILLERHEKKSFLHRIVTGDEKWIHYDNLKPTSQINSKAVQKDQKGVLYYELLKPGETINGERYRTQLIRLKRAIAEKCPEYATRHEAIIFHHDNVRPHVAIPVKNYLKNSEC